MKGLQVIRDLKAADRPAFLTLWQGFLDHYDTTLAPGVTEATWARLMDPACPMKGLVAEVGGQVQGFALYQHHPSSWVLGDDCYLEDLFVAPEARGRGLGRALIEALMDRARAQGWHRIWWMTDQSNATARALYDRLVPDDNHIRYRRALQEDRQAGPGGVTRAAVIPP